jgi:oligosaccharide 4-alpha-D-glucosyltransferase
MTGKLQPYIYLTLFFVVIFLIFQFSGNLKNGKQNRPDVYKSHKIETNKLLLQSQKGEYVIEFLSDDIAAVNFRNSKNPSVDSSLAVILPTDNRAISVTEKNGRLIFGRDNFEIQIDKDPLKIHFVKSNSEQIAVSDGFFHLETERGFRFGLTEDEKIYGAGFRTTPTNRRNQRFELYNQAHYAYNLDSPNLNFSVPFVLSSNGYGLLFDNGQKGWLDIDVSRKNTLEFSAIGGKMGFYLVTGEDYNEVLLNYATLTGFQPMPPRWALGNIQSRFGYETQQEAEAVVADMIQAGYPLDALVIDLYWFGEGVHDSFYMGNLEWYKKSWPDPEDMIKNFSDKGVKTILITEPFILKESKYFDTLSRAGMLGKNADGSTHILQEFWFGKGGTFDIFQPRMRDWFWEKYKARTDEGVAGWWGDLGEPEKNPPEMHFAAGTADQIHNIYAHVWHQMLYERFAETYPDVRLFNLNRAGFAGSQRYAIYPWSGDVSRDWAGLQAQPTAVLGMTLSGFSYMHSDLGGFAMGEKDEELYVRWLQYGVFNPIYRPHGDPFAPVEPIAYSSEAQDILKRFIQLRYQMLPYNYTLAWKNATTGAPITRPLFFEEPDNPAVENIADNFLWGENILVAPVMERGQKIRNVYLPKGLWYDFFTGEQFEGGRWIEQPLTLETIPVFVRGGSFIPMIEPIQTTDNYSSENLIVHYFSDESRQESKYTLFEDDGLTKDAITKDQYELLDFAASLIDNLEVFTFTRNIAGRYNGMPENRNIELVIHGITMQPGRILIGDRAIAAAGAKAFESAKQDAPFYNSETNTLRLKFHWKGEKIDVQVGY